MRKLGILAILLLLVQLFLTPVAWALELEVTNNGSDSANEVVVSQNTQTTIQQENNSDVMNSIEENLDTGNNEASGNTGGDLQIQTGNIDSQTSVDNQLNTSSVDTECCPTSTTINISGNGSDSTNEVDLQQESTSNITINQNVTISNSITGYANSGDNTANYNSGGDTTITTGDIKIQNEIVNSSINLAGVKTTNGVSGIDAKIFENGTDSNNFIRANLARNADIYINHASNIENFILWEATTGKNEANGNTGENVTISTGDIDLKTFINNFVNMSEVEVDCCPPFDPGEPPFDDGELPENGEKPSDNGNSKGGGGGGGGGQLLPSAAATEAGGPGIIGLSDTSSSEAQALIFWVGLTMLALGGKIVMSEILPKRDE